MMAHNTIIDSLRGRLIVSCQAEGGSPFNNPQSIAAFAQVAETGNAAAVRVRDFDNVSIVRKKVGIPIIGLTKAQYPDGSILITPSLDDAITLQKNGADIVAVDGTSRPRHGHSGGAEIIRRMKDSGLRILLADVASVEDGLAAEKAGADMVATTLSGYTSASLDKSGEPDFQLIRELAAASSIPVLAEGRIWTPDQAKHALECGAWAVVVGSAITRPLDIIQRFIKTMSVVGFAQEGGLT